MYSVSHKIMNFTMSLHRFFEIFIFQLLSWSNLLLNIFPTDTLLMPPYTRKTNIIISSRNFKKTLVTFAVIGHHYELIYIRSPASFWLTRRLFFYNKRLPSTSRTTNHEWDQIAIPRYSMNLHHTQIQALYQKNNLV